MAVPVVAHGIEDSIVELNGARDEQRGMFWLRRHGPCLIMMRRRVGEGVGRRTEVLRDKRYPIIGGRGGAARGEFAGHGRSKERASHREPHMR